VDAITNEPILTRRGISASRGMLGFPAGGSGDKTTLLLGGCGRRFEPYDSSGIPQRFQDLNLTKIPSP
jgi:hypothetical protein